QALILIFPNHGRVRLQKRWHQFGGRLDEQLLGVLRSVFEGGVVVLGFAPLLVVPMSHLVGLFILIGPALKPGSEGFWDFFEGHARLAAMVASQAVGDDIAGKERQQRSPATGGLDVTSGNADQSP
ncbi:MAG: hypothetical protein EBZ48_17890, partial [Proteobacteria bacterium]|nr:hypothetical protein [Pseudomonadota bacterium]